MEPGPRPNVDVLIRGIHAAAGSGDGWAGAVSGLRSLLRGRAAMLARHDFDSGRGEWLCESPARPAERKAYPQHSLHNPWFLSSSEYRPGRVMTGDELIDPDLLRRSDFYRRHLEPLGLHHRLCGVIQRDADIVFYAEVLRGPGQPAFDDDERALFASILAHLTIALANHRQFVVEHRENSAMRSVMDRMESAVLVVDEDANVLFANARTAQLLEGFAGLEMRGERIAAASRSENRALRAAIADAAANGATNGAGDASPAACVTLSSPGVAYPVAVSVLAAGNGPLPALGGSRRCAVLVAKDPRHRNGEFDCCAFASLFDLTPAQERLAALILAGHRLSDASRVLGVSGNTARSHLKQVYLKTDTHSQVELVQPPRAGLRRAPLTDRASTDRPARTRLRPRSSAGVIRFRPERRHRSVASVRAGPRHASPSKAKGLHLDE